MKGFKSLLPWLAFMCVVVGMGNFFWFIGETVKQGGDALNGYIRNGQYYVGEHGAYTRVNQQTWEWSHTHAIITIVTFLLAFGSLYFLMFRYILPAFAGLRTDDAAQAREQAIRSSGAVITKTVCSGRTGGIRINGIAVTVYPDGVILQPRFMSAVAISRADIKRVAPQKGWFNRESIEVTHRSPDISSPLTLDVSPQSPVTQAIIDIAQALAAT